MYTTNKDTSQTKPHTTPSKNDTKPQVYTNSSVMTVPITGIYRDYYKESINYKRKILKGEMIKKICQKEGKSVTPTRLTSVNIGIAYGRLW